MIKYPKIYAPFKRDPNNNKVLLDHAWTRDEFEYLADSEWIFTEKIDGTNIRIGWDGHKVTIGGRTDNAQIPFGIIEYINEHLPEEMFEQVFGAEEVTLFGEGFGAGIQAIGGCYSDTKQFALFDVRIGDWWLRFDDVVDVADKLGINRVPRMCAGSLHDGIKLVRKGLHSFFGDFIAEGLVGQTLPGLQDRAGERLLVKIKSCDFYHPETAAVAA